MGRFQKGILGSFSGKIGTVVGGKVNGVNVTRSLPEVRKKPRDTKQEIQRLKFSLVTKFLRMIRLLLNISFKHAGTSNSGYNNAFSYNVQKAITGAYPDFELNYSAARIAQGTFLSAELAAVVSNGPGKIRFTWIDNGDLRVTLRLVNPGVGCHLFFLNPGIGWQGQIMSIKHYRRL